MRRVVPSPPPADPLVTDAATFGAMLRAARTKTGMTLVDAAMTLGLSKQTLGDLETAKASVGLVTALKAARELGVAIFAVPADERERVRRQIVALRKEASPSLPPESTEASAGAAKRSAVAKKKRR